jgi:hypothetical protein
MASETFFQTTHNKFYFIYQYSLDYRYSKLTQVLFDLWVESNRGPRESEAIG